MSVFEKKWVGKSKGQEAQESELITTQKELLSTELFVNKNLQYAGPAILIIGIGLIGLAGYFWMQQIEFMELALACIYFFFGTRIFWIRNHYDT